MTTTGIPAPALTKTGALPSGVSFTDNLDGTATISGTPTDGTAGVHALTITAANGISPNATQNFTLTVNAATAPAIQIPTGGCVTAGSALSIPRAGSKSLMRPRCVTNVDQPVGVRVNTATPRGDLTYYKLFCSYKSKTFKTRSAGYGGGYQLCRKGTLKIRTYGTPLRLKISWFAPATTYAAAYKATKTYRT